MTHSLALRVRSWAMTGIALAVTSCAGHKDRPRAPYVPLAELEGAYGRLITAGNHPTADQNGTGDRVGLFLDSAGTVWGLPVTIAAGGVVLGCAPPGLHDTQV